MPTRLTRTSGRVRHIRPLPSDSSDDEGAGLGDGEVGAGDRDPGPQELLAEVLPGRCRERRRLVGQVVRRRPPGRRHPGAEDLADLGPVLVDRRHEDVRRQVVAELDDQLGQIGLPGGDPLRGKGFVELDLLGGHRLDLDDLGRAVVPRDLRDDRARLGGVPGPVHDGAPRGKRLLQPHQVLVEVGERLVLDPRGLAAAPPSRRPRRRRAPACRGWCWSRGRGSRAAGCRRARRAPPGGTAASRRTSPPIRLDAASASVEASTSAGA